MWFWFVDFSPDFFKRKTWTHHYLLCVVCLLDRCPSPRGVPLFANTETGSLASGKAASALSLSLRAWSLLGAACRPWTQCPGQNRCSGAAERKRATLPARWALGFFSFILGFCFFFFFFPHFPFIPWHNEACLSQCYAMDFYENSVSATQFFLMQYIHL